jgi:hypothetical protein
MPTNRTRIVRPLRQPAFSDEALSLFLELKHLSQDSAEFKSGSKQLAKLLGLAEEHFLSGCHVNDKDKECPWPLGHCAQEDWQRCREMRIRLLQAVKERPPLRLSESELEAVYSAAAPIDVDRRDEFLRSVATALEGRAQVGPGDVHRAIVEAQRTHCKYPNLEKTNGHTKFG